MSDSTHQTTIPTANVVDPLLDQLVSIADGKLVDLPTIHQIFQQARSLRSQLTLATGKVVTALKRAEKAVIALRD